MIHSGHRLRVVGVIMTYNCSKFLERTWQNIPKNVFEEFIVVDDGSLDCEATQKISERFGLQFFSHPHKGYGGNIKYGFQKAVERGADVIVEIHGDGQYDISAAAPGIEKIKQGYDFVSGSRFIDTRQPLRDNMPWVRYFANIVLSLMAKLVLRTPLTEYHCGFRVYSRHMLAVVNLVNTSDDYVFGVEIIAQASYARLKIAEVPVRCFYGNEHTSMSIPKSIRYAFQMIIILFKYVSARAGFRVKLFERATSS